MRHYENDCLFHSSSCAPCRQNLGKIFFIDLVLNSWLVVQNLKIARSRNFIFPEALRLTLVKGIVRIKNVELRPLIKARREKREVVSDWTKSVDQSKTEALVRDFQRVDKLLLPAQDGLRNFDVSGF